MNTYEAGFMRQIGGKDVSAWAIGTFVCAFFCGLLMLLSYLRYKDLTPEEKGESILKTPDDKSKGMAIAGVVVGVLGIICAIGYMFD